MASTCLGRLAVVNWLASAGKILYGLFSEYCLVSQDKLFWVLLTARVEISEPITAQPSIIASAKMVPLPQNGSRIVMLELGGVDKPRLTIIRAILGGNMPDLGSILGRKRSLFCQERTSLATLV